MLAGVTVLDFSLQLPGPYATMLLAACGARVIAVEPPGGDPARVFDPQMVETLAAGKERITLDLKTEAGRGEAHRLAAEADVVVEGFRPGVAARLGIAYDELRALQPRLVYCSISGFGQTGPYAQVPGHDVNYLGVAGGEHRGGVGVPMVDLATGTTAAFLIAAALREGSGRYLDVALLDSAVFWSRLKDGHRHGGDEAGYGIFRAADGELLSLGVVEEKFRERLDRVVGGEDAAARLEETIATRPRAEWLAALWEADVPAAPVNPPDRVHADSQVAERRLFERGRLRAPIPPLEDYERP
jgi:CoA:oxalate CoA-transferase